jgi:hypothetical protein
VSALGGAFSFDTRWQDSNSTDKEPPAVWEAKGVNLKSSVACTKGVGDIRRSGRWSSA